MTSSAAAASAATPEVRPRPLEGLRVLDLSRFIAGPFAGRMLSDLGADVVKIEPPEGDTTRLFGVVRDGLAGLFVQENAGKRNVCVDLKAPGAADLIAELAAKSDIVVENFRPGVLDKFGLGWDVLSKANPKLIMLSVSGFGAEGPESQRQAYAPIIHAESGWVGRVTEMHGVAPRDSVMSFADSIAGLHGMVGLLAALHLRGHTGRGQHIDLCMLDAWFATDDYVHYMLDGAGLPVAQGGEVWDAPGGRMMLNRTLPHVWKLLKAAYGLTSSEPAGADIPAKEQARRAAIREWMSSFPGRDTLKRALEKANLAWGEVRTSETLLDSPTLTARGMVAAVEDGAGRARLVAQTPYRFSDAESGVRRGAAQMGEHNGQVLAEWLGLGEEAVAGLAAQGVLRSAAAAGAARS